MLGRVIRVAKLIHLVGSSGTGKGSVHKYLVGYLRGQGGSVVELVEPPEPFHQFIKNYRLRPDKDALVEAAMFATARLWLYETQVMPRLEDPNLVFLSDRGLLDSFVYQGVLGGVGVETVQRLNQHVPLPDLAIGLIVDGVEGNRRVLERRGATGEALSANETAAGIARVSNAYAGIGFTFPDMNYRTIDTTSMTLDEVKDVARSYVDEVLA
ncbi:MAG: hypothetical protein ABH864_04775 [archaeon]